MNTISLMKSQDCNYIQLLRNNLASKTQYNKENMLPNDISKLLQEQYDNKLASDLIILG